MRRKKRGRTGQAIGMKRGGQRCTRIQARVDRSVDALLAEHLAEETELLKVSPFSMDRQWRPKKKKKRIGKKKKIESWELFFKAAE